MPTFAILTSPIGCSTPALSKMVNAYRVVDLPQSSRLSVARNALLREFAGGFSSAVRTVKYMIMPRPSAPICLVSPDWVTRYEFDFLRGTLLSLVCRCDRRALAQFLAKISA